MQISWASDQDYKLFVSMLSRLSLNFFHNLSVPKDSQLNLAVYGEMAARQELEIQEENIIRLEYTITCRERHYYNEIHAAMSSIDEFIADFIFSRNKEEMSKLKKANQLFAVLSIKANIDELNRTKASYKSAIRNLNKLIEDKAGQRLIDSQREYIDKLSINLQRFQYLFVTYIYAPHVGKGLPT